MTNSESDIILPIEPNPTDAAQELIASMRRSDLSHFRQLSRYLMQQGAEQWAVGNFLRECVRYVETK